MRNREKHDAGNFSESVVYLQHSFGANRYRHSIPVSEFITVRNCPSVNFGNSRSFGPVRFGYIYTHISSRFL